MDKPQYLYDRKGPWPQPNPAHPFGEAPAVVHIPKKEKRTWYWNIGLRYMRNMLTYWPVALYKAWKNPSWEILSDETFSDQIYTSPLSKFLNKTIDKNLLEIFDDLLKNKDANDEYFVADFICMKDQVYMCSECVQCRHPKDYCKFRPSCTVWFLDKEDGAERKHKKE